MSRRTISERYDALEARGDELAGLPPAAATPVHIRTVDVLTDLLEMGEQLSSGETPAPLRALMGMLRRCRPLMLDQLTAVPPEAIRAFMGELIAKMQTICDTPDGATHDSDGEPGARTA